MAKKQLRRWHYQVTTALAIVTLLFVIAFFAQSFRSLYLTDHDPVLIAIDRIEQKVDGQ